MAFDTSQPAYQALRAVLSERTESLVFWVGAGLSVPAGLPTWDGLRGLLSGTLKAKARSCDDPEKTSLLKQSEVIEGFEDPWLALERLKEALGETTFRATVRSAFSSAVSVAIPQAYMDIWAARPAGILTLNLDRLATRAAQATGSDLLIEFNGFRAGDYVHVLKGHRPFVVNLHGVEEDYASWVLTREKLRALLRKESYRAFLQALLMSKTVVFVGITADDTAVEGHLERLRDLFDDVGTHYWITPRRDGATDAWAESAGIQVIRYNAPEGDHSELEELFEDALSFISKDPEAPPVVPPVSPSREQIPPPSELAGRESDEIRSMLNAAAKEIMSEESAEAYEEYREFCKRYDEPIYRAWYVTTESPSNRLLGYTLDRQVAEGSFGVVYHAYRDGEDVAVKILHEKIRSDRGALETFRRGIRSMTILESRGVKGVVPFFAAAEIPAFVAMKWIDGPTLTEAVEAGYLDDWHSVLAVAQQLARIIQAAHGLPERVLHRDIRPNNVMLSNYYRSGVVDVVVLDFDLSWHRGAIEQSVVRTTSTSYLAPEQMQEDAGVSTRHSAVDSFGLGMTLFFMVSGRDPMPAEHMHRDWDTKVGLAVASRPRPEWRSLPARFGRLVQNCTRNEQAERWDISQALGELELLQSALADPNGVSSAEMVAEEIVRRCGRGREFVPERDASSFELQLASGVQVTVAGDDQDRVVRLTARWQNTGVYEWKRIGKWLPSAIRVAEAQLQKAGWDCESQVLADSATISASQSVEALLRTGALQSPVVDQLVEALSFR